MNLRFPSCCTRVLSANKETGLLDATLLFRLLFALGSFLVWATLQDEKASRLLKNEEKGMFFEFHF